MVHGLTLTIVLTTALQGAAVNALTYLTVLLAQSDSYGFWGPIISILRGVGLAASGVGLIVAILVKGAAGTNKDRHALAAKVAEGVLAGLFIVLLGWFIYDRMVEWTPL